MPPCRILTCPDYAGNKPDNLVRVGNGAGSEQIALSGNGGQSWYIHYGTDQSKNSGNLAYSADADTIVWSSGNAGVVRSVSQGTFSAVASLPSGAVVASDKRTNANFYAGSGAAFYRSTDTGATFTKVTTAFPATVTAVKDIAAHPAVAGEVWVSTNAGVFRSTDSGATFAQAGSIASTEAIAFGKGDSAAWNVYVFGVGSAGAKLYASGDLGATWTDVQGTQGLGAIGANRVVGSGNVAGQVYVGTNGRGVFYAKVSVSGGGGTTSSSTVSSSSTKTSTTLSTSTIKTTSSTTSSSTVKTTSSSTIINNSTTSKATSTTSSTSTFKSTSTSSSAAPTGTATADRWAQCGGNNWTGPTQCVAPWTCQKQNDWYSQCL